MSALFLFVPILGCRRHQPIAIAVIPRTCGTMLWEAEHSGAQLAALDLGARIYWNAPTREDDVEGQIALVQRISSENYQGLVLAPDQARALIMPVRRAMQRGLSVVIVGSPLSIPPGDRLAYIINDDEAGGRIAGQRLGTILHGQGTVAILGVDGDISGVMTRTRSLESFLAASYPRIRIVKRMGSFNLAHEQQVAEEVFKTTPDLNAVVALTSTSTLGVVSALADLPRERKISVIGFDPETLLLENPRVDSVVLQNTEKMGEEAVRLIVGKSSGHTVPPITRMNPVLMTRENADSPEVRQIISMGWWSWRSVQ